MASKHGVVMNSRVWSKAICTEFKTKTVQIHSYNCSQEHLPSPRRCSHKTRSSIKSKNTILETDFLVHIGNVYNHLRHGNSILTNQFIEFYIISI